MFDKIQGIGLHVLIIRDIPPEEKSGFSIPDIAKKKPSSGEIITIGQAVKDKAIKKGKKALFAQGSGFPIEIEDKEFTVLMEGQIICVI